MIIIDRPAQVQVIDQHMIVTVEVDGQQQTIALIRLTPQQWGGLQAQITLMKGDENEPE